MTTDMHTTDRQSLVAADALDDELGIELLDDMVEEDFWDGFVVGASLGGAAATGAIAIGIAT
jgi:hypothetical protein